MEFAADSSKEKWQDLMDRKGVGGWVIQTHQHME